MDPNAIEADGAGSTLEALFVSEILKEYREGREPLVSYHIAHRCLHALGRPLPLGTVKDLAVDVRNLGGKSVAPLSAFINEADAFIKRRLARPNLKKAAAARARAARGGAGEAA